MQRTRIALVGLAAGAFVAVSAAPASAHVSNEPTEAPAGSFTEITLTVPHGCDGAPTSGIAVQVPEGVFSVTPQVHFGWDVAVDTEPLTEPVDLGEGEVATERPTVVTFTAQPGNELPDGFRDQFTIGYVAPDTPGEYLFFKTIQTCTGGVETAWVEEYTGEGEEPEHPSPVVLLVEATGDDHGEEETTETTAAEEEATETTEASEATEVAAEPVADSGDDDSDTLAIVALVVGALGLGFGGAAFARSRKA